MKHPKTAFSLFLIVAVAVAVFAFSARNSAASGTTPADAAKTKSVASPAEQAIAGEKAMWEAEKKRDRPAFEKLASEDYAEITSEDGFLDRETILKTFDQNGLQDYSLGPIKTEDVHPGVVLLTYTFHVKEMHEKVMHEGDYLASSLWANRSGKWVNVFFQDTRKP